MTATDHFKTFEPKLQWAFIKMINGIDVRIKREVREGTTLHGKNVFITAIAEDETVTIQDHYHNIVEGVRLNDIIL